MDIRFFINKNRKTRHRVRWVSQNNLTSVRCLLGESFPGHPSTDSNSILEHVCSLFCFLPPWYLSLNNILWVFNPFLLPDFPDMCSVKTGVLWWVLSPAVTISEHLCNEWMDLWMPDFYRIPFIFSSLQWRKLPFSAGRKIAFSCPRLVPAVSLTPLHHTCLHPSQ